MTMTPEERAEHAIMPCRKLPSVRTERQDGSARMEWVYVVEGDSDGLDPLVARVAAAIREAVEEAKAVCVMIAHNEGDAFGAVPEASNACRSVAVQIERHYDVFAHAYRKISTSSQQSATRSESVE